LNGRKFWMRGEKREAEIKKQKTERKKKGGKFLNEGRISSVEKRETERGEQKKKREEEDLFERQRRESQNGREERKTETGVSARRRRTVPHPLKPPQRRATVTLPSSSPPAETVLPVGNNTVRNRRRKQKQRRTELKKKKTQRRKGRKGDHRPSHSPGRRHQHVHEAAAERGKNISDRRKHQRSKGEEANGEAIYRRVKSFHKSTCFLTLVYVHKSIIK